ncbi:MAG: hypothetical protein KJ739_03855 [Nitrospinae bacterium]|nr:hypothetical protein [Nitrospinota bacterium]
MEAKLKHLEMIQGVINRMANNSFLLKGWSVILVSGLFALAAKDSNKLYIYLSYFPSLAFWVLDGYFLRQEKLYRKLYDKVRSINDSEIDFSMDTSSVTNQVHTWSEVIFSKTLSFFHGVIVLTILLVMLIASLL